MAVPQLPANSIVQVMFEWEYQGSKLLNVLHYKSSNEIPLDNYASILNELGDKFDAPDGFITAILPFLSAEVLLRSCKVQPVYPVRLAPIEAFFLRTGDAIEPGLPSNVALVATKGSYVATRKGKGSFHLGGLTTAALGADGQWDQGVFAAMNTAFNKLEAPINLTNPVVTFQPVLWSPETPTTQIDLVDYEVQPTYRVMRRRTKGIGI